MNESCNKLVSDGGKALRVEEKCFLEANVMQYGESFIYGQHGGRRTYASASFARQIPLETGGV